MAVWVAEMAVLYWCICKASTINCNVNATVATATQNTGIQLKMQQISTLIRQSNVTVSMLNMQAEQLQMTLIANNRQSLDSLVANLQQAGINARLGSVSNMAANTAQTDNNTPSEQIQGQLLVTLDAANS